jgi:Rrf2 family transcriptional regulator, iron-sulfur cluster assembly transcription factor
MRLELTRRGDYAVRAMLALARGAAASPRGRPSGDGRLSVARIAASEAIPPRILPSVMRLLTRAGLVDAQTGRTGGYRLARRADRISLLDIIEAVEGDIRRRSCTLRGGPCLANGECAVHGVFASAEAALRDSLAEATLAGAAAAPWPESPSASAWRPPRGPS